MPTQRVCSDWRILVVRTHLRTLLCVALPLAYSMQQEQLAAVTARKAAEKEAARLEGLDILRRSMEEVEVDKKKAWDRRMWHKRNNEGKLAEAKVPSATAAAARLLA